MPTLKQQIESKLAELEKKLTVIVSYIRYPDESEPQRLEKSVKRWNDFARENPDYVLTLLSQALHDIAVAAVEEVGVGDDIEFKDKVGNWNLQKAITYQKGYLKCFNILAAKKAEIIKSLEEER